MRKIDAEALLETRPPDEDIVISPTEISYVSSRYDSAAELTIKGIPNGDLDTVRAYPERSSEEVPATMLCWASTDRSETNDERPGSIIGGGELMEGSVDEEGIWTGVVVDCVRKLRQSTFSGEYTNEAVTDIAEDILDDAGIRVAVREPGTGGGVGISGAASYVVRTPRETAPEDDVTGPDAGTAARPPLYTTSIEFTDALSFEALTEVLSVTNWWWWCRPDNTIIVDTQLPTETYALPYITETSAGKQTPPWQAVEVIGARQGSSAQPAGVQEGERVIGTGTPVRATSGNGEPVFTRTDRSIETQEKAQAVADHILRELLAQQKGGTITALGNEAIRPLDAVQLPEHMGGESYLVSALTHTLSKEKGFITEIECGGLMDPGEDGELNTDEPPPEGSSGGGNDQGTAATPDGG